MRIILILALLALTACSAKPLDDPAQPTNQPAAGELAEIPADIHKLVSSYDELELITPKPYDTSMYLATLCVAVPQTDVEETHGPHALAAVNIYMNDTAAKAHRQSRTPYPVGSIIIKEKLHDVTPDGKRAKSHNGLGGMIKRPAGYDPDHGDWEYFYAESQNLPLYLGKGSGEGDPAVADESNTLDTEKITFGRIDTCVECHAKATDKDHVFGSWAKKTANHNTQSGY